MQACMVAGRKGEEEYIKFEAEHTRALSDKTLYERGSAIASMSFYAKR